jgi:hypothetical protein
MAHVGDRRALPLAAARPRDGCVACRGGVRVASVAHRGGELDQRPQRPPHVPGTRDVPRRVAPLAARRSCSILDDDRRAGSGGRHGLKGARCDNSPRCSGRGSRGLPSRRGSASPSRATLVAAVAGTRRLHRRSFARAGHGEGRVVERRVHRRNPAAATRREMARRSRSVAVAAAAGGRLGGGGDHDRRHANRGRSLGASHPRSGRCSVVEAAAAARGCGVNPPGSRRQAGRGVGHARRRPLRLLPHRPACLCRGCDGRSVVGRRLGRGRAVPARMGRRDAVARRVGHSQSVGGATALAGRRRPVRGEGHLRRGVGSATRAHSC